MKVIDGVRVSGTAFGATHVKGYIHSYLVVGRQACFRRSGSVLRLLSTHRSGIQGCSGKGVSFSWGSQACAGRLPAARCPQVALIKGTSVCHLGGCRAFLGSACVSSGALHDATPAFRNKRHPVTASNNGCAYLQGRPLPCCAASAARPPHNGQQGW